MTDNRWAHLTYSSFQAASGGGWQVGDALHASQKDREMTKQYAVTRLVTPQEIDVFLSAQKINNLPRRCDYVLDSGCGVFVQAMPSGRDATKRPGNVFSHVVIDHSPTEPAEAHPIQWYRSDDLLQPFGHRAVNDSSLPAGLAEPKPNQYGELFVAWMMVRGMSGGEDDRDKLDVLLRVQDLLSAPPRLAILLVDVTDDAARWIAALSSTMSREQAATSLQFSTYLRAAELEAFPIGEVCTVVAMPKDQRAEVPAQFAGCVVDPAEPAAEGPQSWWAVRTAQLIEEGTDEQELGGLISPELDLPLPSEQAAAPFADEVAGILRQSTDLQADLRRIDAQAITNEASAGDLQVVERYTLQANGLPNRAFADTLRQGWAPRHPELQRQCFEARVHQNMFSYLLVLNDPSGFPKLLNRRAPAMPTADILDTDYFHEMFADAAVLQKASRRVLDLMMHVRCVAPKSLLSVLEALLALEEEAGCTPLEARVPADFATDEVAQSRIRSLSGWPQEFPRAQRVFNVLGRPTQPLPDYPHNQQRNI